MMPELSRFYGPVIKLMYNDFGSTINRTCMFITGITARLLESMVRYSQGVFQ